VSGMAENKGADRFPQRRHLLPGVSDFAFALTLQRDSQPEPLGNGVHFRMPEDTLFYIIAAVDKYPHTFIRQGPIIKPLRSLQLKQFYKIMDHRTACLVYGDVKNIVHLLNQGLCVTGLITRAKNGVVWGMLCGSQILTLSEGMKNYL